MPKTSKSSAGDADSIVRWNIRLPRRVMDRLDAYARKLKSEGDGIQSRNNVGRRAIEYALDQWEKSVSAGVDLHALRIAPDLRFDRVASDFVSVSPSKKEAWPSSSAAVLVSDESLCFVRVRLDTERLNKAHLEIPFGESLTFHSKFMPITAPDGGQCLQAIVTRERQQSLKTSKSKERVSKR